MQQVENQVVNFASLFVEAAKEQQQEEAETRLGDKDKDEKDGKSDISVTDTQCKP